MFAEALTCRLFITCEATVSTTCPLEPVLYKKAIYLDILPPCTRIYATMMKRMDQNGGMKTQCSQKGQLIEDGGRDLRT